MLMQQEMEHMYTYECDSTCETAYAICEYDVYHSM